MAKYRVAPGIRAVKRQRTTQELERERELRDLQETTVKRRRDEAVAQKLRKAEVFPSMEKQQAPVTEPSEYAIHQERGVEAPVLTEPISTTMTEPAHQQGAEASVPAEIITEAALGRASLVDPMPQPLHSKPVKKSVAEPLPSALTLLGTAEAAFYLDHEVRRCTERTMEGYRHDVAVFARWLEAHEVVEPQQITAQQIRLFLQEIDSRNVSAYTLHRYARVIRAFCNFLVKEEIISRSPMARVGMPRLPKELLPAFTVDEVQRLLNAAKHSLHPIQDTAVVLALLDTGCRSAELLALNVGDLDLKTGQVMVRQGKGRKDRLTFLGTKARQAVVQYLRERGISTSHEPLWLTDESHRLTKAGLRQLLGRLAQRAGLSDVHPHKFRRTFALWSLRAGMNIYSLQMLMGHSSLEMLRRYLALVEADLEKQHREHGAVDCML